MAFRRMHVGLQNGNSSKIGRKVLRRAFCPPTRKNVPSDNSKADLARNKVINRGKFYSSSSANLAISEEIHRPGSKSRAI